MKKFAIICSTFLCAFSGKAQFTMSDPGFPPNAPMNCNVYSDGSAQNWFDQGGVANYGPNYNDTIVICPDLNTGTKATVVFATNAGFSFQVDPSDSIYVYDGPNTSAPLLGVHNSGTDPNGFTHQASWNNPSGCLTIVFITDGANEAPGWVGNVTCGSPNQPFEVHMEAFVNGSATNDMSPVDTGFVDVCLGDSILLVAKPVFPYSFENTGYGYSQNLTNVVYDWNISGAGQSFPDNDSIWFVPPAHAGYLVDLKITDAFPQSYRIISKVRVSIPPIFAGTGPLEDTVCMGQQTQLLGGVTPTDTVGTFTPQGQFNLGGAFAGLTYLPDGSGAQYQAPVSISGFPDGATIGDIGDLDQVCITMEHTFLGDLEIALECPNGTQVSLVNSYGPGGFIPGGFNGGGTFLGDADDLNGNGVPGIGWEYCFSPTMNTFQTMGAELAAGNTVPTTVTPGNQSMNPNGIYLPDGDFNAFAGCPVNGDWTIVVQDNLGIDDGYIFEWGLYFDPSLQPGLGGYQNFVVDDFWTNDPTIVAGQNDTAIVVVPNAPGAHSYTYNVVDNFGCSYDTTVVLYTLPQPTIFPDTIACFQNFNVQGTTAYAGGVWSATDTTVHFSNPNILNPSISVTVPGTYTVTFTDNACNTSISAEIYYPAYIYTQVLDTVICAGAPYTINALQQPAILNYSWSTGGTGPSITISQPGVYVVTATNECYTVTDTAVIGTKVCDIQVPNIITLSSMNGNNLFFVEHEGVKEFECVIVNRWGNKIYEYTDPQGAWDGRTLNGNLVEDGTYFYIIKAVLENDEELTKQGFVQVYR